MARPKMFPPMPDSGETEFDRFQQFAKSILAVPKSEIAATTTVTAAMKQKSLRTIKPEKPIKPHRTRKK
jgi:hypothetical protein